MAEILLAQIDGEYFWLKSVGSQVGEEKILLSLFRQRYLRQIDLSQKYVFPNIEPN